MAQQTSPTVEPTPRFAEWGGLDIFQGRPDGSGDSQLPPEQRQYGATDLATMWNVWGHLKRPALAAVPD